MNYISAYNMIKNAESDGANADPFSAFMAFKDLPVFHTADDSNGKKVPVFDNSTNGAHAFVYNANPNPNGTPNFMPPSPNSDAFYDKFDPIKNSFRRSPTTDKMYMPVKGSYMEYMTAKRNVKGPDGKDSLCVKDRLLKAIHKSPFVTVPDGAGGSRVLNKTRNDFINFVTDASEARKSIVNRAAKDPENKTADGKFRSPFYREEANFTDNIAIVRAEQIGTALNKLKVISNKGRDMGLDARNFPKIDRKMEKVIAEYLWVSGEINRITFGFSGKMERADDRLRGAVKTLMNRKAALGGVINGFSPYYYNLLNVQGLFMADKDTGNGAGSHAVGGYTMDGIQPADTTMA